MTEYSPPCEANQCARGFDSDSAKRLCRDIGRNIINAGGAGLLEATPCPIDALKVIGPEQSDVLAAEVRSRLGIVGYSEGSYFE